LLLVSRLVCGSIRTWKPRLTNGSSVRRRRDYPSPRPSAAWSSAGSLPTNHRCPSAGDRNEAPQRPPRRRPPGGTVGMAARIFPTLDCLVGGGGDGLCPIGTWVLIRKNAHPPGLPPGYTLDNPPEILTGVLLMWAIALIGPAIVLFAGLVVGWVLQG